MTSESPHNLNTTESNETFTPVAIVNTVPIHVTNGESSADFYTKEAIKKLPNPDSYDGTIDAIQVKYFTVDITDYFELMELRMPLRLNTFVTIYGN